MGNSLKGKEFTFGFKPINSNEKSYTILQLRVNPYLSLERERERERVPEPEGVSL